MRPIDADKLLKDIEQYHLSDGMFQHWVEVQPTADVKEVKHGHWNKTCVPDVYQCDVCKKSVKMDEFCDSEVLREFCPKCGADMREEEKTDGLD